MKNIFCNKKHFILSLCFVVCSTIIFISSCSKKDNELVVNGSMLLPKLPIQPYRYQNGNNVLATLGRVLFYDRNLSLNNSISCGSCHNQQHAFADIHQFSRGLNNGYTSRNASALLGDGSIYNSPHHRFWDGRAATIDTAVFMPVMNHLEMNIFDLNILPAKLSNLSYYPDLFNAAYSTNEISVPRIRQALASFVANLISNNSKFDSHNFSALESQGENIFHGKGKCYSCHNGNNFNGTSSSYENIGLEVNYSDIGRGRITQNTDDNGKFNVPTLRNIALSAPYMHDGRYQTLREVIDHYSEGIQDSKNLSYVFRDIPANVFDTLTFVAHPTVFTPNSGGQSQLLPSADLSHYPVLNLNLTEDEKKALEAFLKTLTDVSFIADPKFSNPF